MNRQLAKIGTTLLLCGAPLFVPMMSLAQELSPTQQQAAMTQSFDQAMEAFVAADYALAFERFAALQTRLPDNLSVNFYLARSAIALKRYDEALMSLDRVLIIDPDHVAGRLEMARLYYELHQYSMASTELEHALSLDMPDDIRADAEGFGELLTARQSRHHLTTTLMVGLGYDSNASNDIGGSNSFELPGFGNIGISGRDKIADYGLTQALRLDHTYDFGLRGGWYLENRFLVMNRNNKKESANDLFYLSGQIAPTYYADQYKVSFPFHLDEILLDYSHYLTSTGPSVRYDYRLSPSLQLSATYLISHLSYATDSRPRNAWSHKGVIGVQKNLTEQEMLISASLGYEDRRQRSSSRYFSDPASLTEWSLSAELSKSLSDKLRGSVGYSWRQTDYDETNLLFANRRSDRVNRIDMSLIYALDKQSAVSLTLTHADHSSNQRPYSFDKSTAALNYIIRF
ncbi:tetratricopeptide repeat protein [Nitrincola sp. MINF-07-Sa-05]|uniref:tetratricopeptide repeat protein n=1 Tax=Nitrincola salilacus TaxID=3400273 RepID=UPI003917CF1C